jgi:hypothetical protein
VHRFGKTITIYVHDWLLAEIIFSLFSCMPLHDFGVFLPFAPWSGHI